MERYEISPGAAFSLLTRLSRESNKPVVVIAKELVETKPKRAGADPATSKGARPARRPEHRVR